MTPKWLSAVGQKFGEKKPDKEKSHKGIWRSDAPEASQGQTRDIPGTPAWWTFRIFFIFFLLGEGAGEFEAPGEGGSVFN